MMVTAEEWRLQREIALPIAAGLSSFSECIRSPPPVSLACTPFYTAGTTLALRLVEMPPGAGDTTGEGAAAEVSSSIP